MTRPPMTRISDVLWEIPATYKRGMSVPARVYANEEMVKGMEGAVFDQLTNMACLPGIQRYALCMADAHSGYGFPVGGVGAFDPEEGGVISPGGVGYDINCLPGDTRILTEFGQSIPIKNFEEIQSEEEIEDNGRVFKKIVCSTALKTINMSTKEIEDKKPLIFMSREAKNLVEISLLSGLKIISTSEHPFLTKRGMQRAEYLERGTEVAVHIFTGTESEPVNREDAITAKIFGYLLGDGCVYKSEKKYYAVAYGQSEDLKTMKNDLQSIGVNSVMYSRTRDHSIPTRYKTINFTTTNHELHIYGRQFILSLVEKGMPLGNKTRQEIRVPEWIKSANNTLKRLFLAGFFGAEMSTPKTSSRTSFYCATIDQNKIKSLRQNIRDYLIDISILLEEFGIKTTKISEMNDFKNKYAEETVRLRLLISGEENLLKLWRIIGFEYNKKRAFSAQVSTLYILLKHQEQKRREELALRIKELRKRGLRYQEVENIIGDVINQRFIRRHYYENAKQRISLNFLIFKDFFKKCEEEFKMYGAIFDKIISIENIQGTTKVYDFTIEDNHNFIAENFVVSNCGMRLIKTNLTVEQVQPRIKKIVDGLFRRVPTGVGCKGFLNLSHRQFNDVLMGGARWAVEQGYGWDNDLECIEDGGVLGGADSSKVSQNAFKRGLNQLGTLGSGNHYLEVQLVSSGKIYDESVSKKFGITGEDQIVLMIHCGSRGVGHQICTDYTKRFLEKQKVYGIDIPDRQLACAPYNSVDAQDYVSAMNCGANMALANRQVITHRVREVFSKEFGESSESLGIDVVYDVSHNIAKLERYKVDGMFRNLVVHRKGATRCFGPGNPALPLKYRGTGQPVIVGGSMETGSYLLVGTRVAEDESFGSTLHGSGRVMSRTQARMDFSGERVCSDMLSRGIYVKARSIQGLAEEAGGAYKNIDDVTMVMERAGISRRVCALRPIGNIKG